MVFGITQLRNKNRSYPKKFIHIGCSDIYLTLDTLYFGDGADIPEHAVPTCTEMLSCKTEGIASPIAFLRAGRL